MDFYRRRRLSTVAICAYLFLGGVEFAVIFPSAWEYLQNLGVNDEYMLGITLSAYSLSGAIGGVLGGHLADVYPNRTGMFCVVCILLMFAGNLLYTIGLNVWNVIASRLVCGLGTAAGASLLAYVCRVTTAKERTAIISICNASRQMGVLIGPACQVLLTQVKMQIGPIQVNSTNAAGLLMAVLWLFVYLPIHFFLGHYDYTIMPLRDYENFPSEQETSKEVSGNAMLTMSSLLHHSLIKKEQICLTESSSWRDNNKYCKQHQHSPTESEIDAPSFAEQLKMLSATNQLVQKKEIQMEDSSDESLPRVPSWERHNLHESSPILQSTRSSVASIANLMASISIDPGCPTDDQPSQPSYKHELLTDTIVSLLGTTFTLFFCQILIETIIPVYMKEIWGFGEVSISMAYLVGGVECLVLFAALIPMSHHISDTILQLIGKLLLFVGFVTLTVVLPFVQIGRESDFWYFVGGCLIVGLAYPIASVSNASLLSKTMSSDVQGIGQGLRRLASYLGLILGPLWAGSAARQPLLLMGVALVIILVHMIMFFHIMKKLTHIERVAMQPQNPDEDMDTNMENNVFT